MIYYVNLDKFYKIVTAMKILQDLNVDLHTHSTASDGSITPSQLVNRAIENGVDILALTDHDTVNGIPEGLETASGTDLTFIPGVEVSTMWGGSCIHVLGLDVQLNNVELKKALSLIQKGRFERAERINLALIKAGLPSILEHALSIAGSKGQIGRVHFARAMIQKNLCEDIRDVFSRYLVKGKPGFVAHEWPSLKTVINLILKANGLPVIAHPARYKLPNNWLTYLLEEFASLGGIGIEVATGSHSLADIERFKKISIEYDFKASRGSDFHSPSESRYDVGRAPYLPDCLLPIWASIGLRG